MRIAVIGSGVAGLSAAWLMRAVHDVTVFEQDARLGGHANTVAIDYDGVPVSVDTGFIVYNERNYPNLVHLFEHLGVATEASQMTFSVSADDGRLEYEGSLRGMLAQPGNLMDRRYWRMMADIMRFFSGAARLLKQPGEGPTLGEWLTRERYGDGFIYDHLLPMGAAIWSCPVQTMLAFPAKSFIRFFDNHQLLNLVDRPQWRTVSGGSRRYVERLASALSGRIRLTAPVCRVTPGPSGVTVETADGSAEVFDQVVFGTHGDQALRLIADLTDGESRILGAFRYQANTAVLHRDPSMMPRRRAAWAAWNYQADRSERSDRRVALTYWMNRLQNLDPARPLFVSMNPLREPGPGLVFARFSYEHPVFDAAAVSAQDGLPSIQGRRGLWFCGSYCGWGFHEDGLKAAIAVGRSLGAEPPWPCGVPSADRRYCVAGPADVLADAAD